jgi:hypothetical protein
MKAVLIALALAILTCLPVGAAYADEPLPPGPVDPPGTVIPAPKPPKPGTELQPYADRVEAVIAAARAQLGKPYRVGAEGPDIFDCSGLVFRAFTDAGEGNQIGVARMRAAGYMRWFAGRELLTTNVEDAERGDLVIFNNGSHIGIYLGDGRVISALTSGVTVHSLTGITLPVTAFLAVDWSGKRGPFVPGVLPPSYNDIEAPAALVPPLTWTTAPSLELAAGPAVLGEERVDMRTATSRTFQTADDKFATEFFTRAIHYLPSDSTEWQPIDLRFRAPEEGETGLGIADTAPTAVTLASSIEKAGLLSVSAGGNSLALGVPGARRAAVEPELALDGTYADYRDVFGPGVGLRVLPRSDGLKAFLVFAKEPANNKFSFVADAIGADGTGLTLLPELDGSITLRDAAGTLLGRIMRPMLLDSSDVEGDGGGVKAAAVSMQLEAPEGASPRLTFAIQRASLDEAVYPAYVDLTLVDFPNTAASALHTFASSAHPAANFSTYQRPEAPAYAELWHGRRPGRKDDNEAYLRFAGVQETLRGMTVESANLAAFPYWQRAGEEAQTTWLGRVAAEWDARMLTWDTRPLADTALTEFDTTQGQWSAMDLTAYAKGVITGALPDYGLVLHADGAGRDFWKRFVVESTLGSGALEPRLVVTWSGLRPVVGPIVAPPGMVTGSGVDLTWSQPGLAPAPWRVKIQVSRDGYESVVAESRLKGDDAAASAFALAVDGLAPGTYTWRAKAKYVVDGEWSAWSDSGTFSIGATKLEAFRQPEF